MTEVSNGAGSEHDSLTYFNKTFHPQKMRLFGGTIDTVDIRPKKTDKSSEESSDKLERPVLLAPGWAETLTINKGPIRVLVEEGQHVLSLTHMLHDGKIPDAYQSVTRQINKRLANSPISKRARDTYIETFLSRWDELAKHYPQVTLRRALTLLALVEEKNIDKVDIVAHSEGCIDAALAAYLCPDKFGNLVMLSSGGIIGEDTAGSLIKRSLKQGSFDDKNRDPLPHNKTGDDDRIAHQIARMPQHLFTPLQGKINVVRHISSNPKRALEEVHTLSSTQIQELLQKIRADNIGVVFIHHVEDQIFPMEAVQSSKALLTDASQALPEGIKGSADGFYSLLGSHNTLYTDPRVMKLAVMALAQQRKNQENAA
jgi:pimeloyl-ACP methyl ester carboxylesterase